MTLLLKEHGHSIKLGFLLWHFCHLNHIWEIFFLKTASPKEIFCSYYLKEFLQLGIIFFTKQTSITVLLTMHTSKSTMITFLSGCKVLFFPGLPLFLSLLLKLVFFTVFTHTSHYIPIISPTKQIGKIRLFYIASC